MGERCTLICRECTAANGFPSVLNFTTRQKRDTFAASHTEEGHHWHLLLDGWPSDDEVAEALSLDRERILADWDAGRWSADEYMRNMIFRGRS